MWALEQAICTYQGNEVKLINRCDIVCRFSAESKENIPRANNISNIIITCFIDL